MKMTWKELVEFITNNMKDMNEVATINPIGAYYHEDGNILINDENMVYTPK